MEARDNPWVKLSRWLIMGLVAILLTEIILLLWTAMNGVSRNDNLLPAGAEGALTVAQLPPREIFNEAVERTVFSWNRRPGRPQSTETTVEQGTLASSWRLTGLVNTGESTYAVFSELEGDGQVRLEKGMDIEGWSVEAVDTSQITLVNEDKREIYRLSVTDVSNPQTEAPAEVSKESQETTGDVEVESEEPDNDA